MSIESNVQAISDRLINVQGTIQQLTDDQFYANLNIENLLGRTPVIGQNTMANSAPIVIASDQSTIGVNEDGTDPTYSAAIIGLVPAATPTDIFEIAGSATKTVKVRRIRVTGVRGTSTTSDIILLKRSTANTGGTSTTLTAVRHDSNDANATALVKAYTANPTVGTLIGNWRADKQFLNSTGAGASDVRDYVITEGGAQPIILRGLSQVCAVNLNGVTMTGGLLDIWVEWTEE